MNYIFRAFFFLAAGVFLVGCGRMLPPFAPEDLAPAQVEELTVTALPSGVQFSWLAPEDDYRGEPLLSLDEYRIERKEIVEPSDVVDETVPFEDVGVVSDRYFLALKSSEEALEEKGLPKRKAKVQQSDREHQFIDETLETGHRYLYRIVPMNQGGEPGAAGSFVDIEFAGLQSSISISQELDSLEDADPFQQDQEQNPLSP